MVRVGMQGTGRAGVGARSLLASSVGASVGTGVGGSSSSSGGGGGGVGSDGGGGLRSLGVGAAAVDSLGLGSSAALGGGGDAVWLRGGFAVLQGRRLLWWRSEAGLEGGQPADAVLRLRGHAGVTAPSPADLRTAGCAPGCLAAVFASEPVGPGGRAASRQRWAVAFADDSECAAFTAAIEDALGKDD